MADHQVRPIAVWMLVYYAAFQETESVEYRSFKSHYADLFNGIQNPVSLSASLYAVDLQSRDTKKKINDFQITEDKVSELLDATETAIRLDPQNFHKFVKEMGKDSSMQHLCGKLRSTCGELQWRICTRASKRV